MYGLAAGSRQQAAGRGLDGGEGAASGRAVGTLTVGRGVWCAEQGKVCRGVRLAAATGRLTTRAAAGAV